MITKVWEVLTWTPPDLYTGEQWQAVSHSLLNLMAEQIALLLSRISSILLSFPLHFLEHAGFLTLYKLILVGSLLFIPTILIYRTVGLVISAHQFKAISRYDILYSFLRFLIIAAIMDQVPWIFSLLCNAANNITQELVANLQLNFIYYSAPEGFTADFAIIVLLIGIFVSGVRLLLYYAVRNATLIWLLLIAPVTLIRWSTNGNKKLLDQWLEQIFSLTLIQIIHALLLITMSQIISAGPPSTANKETAILYFALVQIGIVELMTKAPYLLSSLFDTPPLNDVNALSRAYNYLTGRRAKQWKANLKRRIKNA